MSGRDAVSLAAWAALPLIAGLLHAALHDLRTRRIPNGAVVATAVGALAWRLAAGATPADLAATLAATLLLFAGAFLLWRRGGLGGGDVKLLTAAALAFPAAGILDLVLFTALAGGGLALAMLGMRRLWSRAAPLLIPLAARMGAGRVALTGCSGTGASVPYGVAIAAGALLALAVRWPAM